MSTRLYRSGAEPLSARQPPPSATSVAAASTALRLRIEFLLPCEQLRSYSFTMGQIDLEPQFFEARDGARLAYRELGEGRPVVLIHGFFSTAMVNWVRYGHAARVARQGFRVIMPDLRGHGDSAKPHDPAAYPPDVLTDDAFALTETLGLDDYDLGGYSLGARTTVRLLARGAAPRRAVVAGMGLEGLVHTEGRGEFFRRVLRGLGSFARGSAEWMSEAFLKTVGGDPIALLAVLDSAVNTPAETIARIETPTLVAAGTADRDNGSAAALADTLPHARHVELPGNHMSAVAKPELGEAIADFLNEGHP